MESYPYQVKEG